MTAILTDEEMLKFVEDHQEALLDSFPDNDNTRYARKLFEENKGSKIPSDVLISMYNSIKATGSTLTFVSIDQMGLSEDEISFCKERAQIFIESSGLSLEDSIRCLQSMIITEKFESRKKVTREDLLMLGVIKILEQKLRDKFIAENKDYH